MINYLDLVNKNNTVIVQVGAHDNIYNKVAYKESKQ